VRAGGRTRSSVTHLARPHTLRPGITSFTRREWDKKGTRNAVLFSFFSRAPTSRPYITSQYTRSIVNGGRGAHETLFLSVTCLRLLPLHGKSPEPYTLNTKL